MGLGAPAFAAAAVIQSTLTKPGLVLVPTVKCGTGSFSTDDSAILIHRVAVNSLDNAGSHGVRDESIYAQTSGGGGYASFDAANHMGGSLSMNHSRSFQSRPNLDLQNTVSEVSAVSSETIVATGSTIGNRYGLYFIDGVGAGTISAQYALFCPALIKGDSGNYCIYNSGAANNYLGTGITQIGAGGQLLLPSSFSTYGAFLTHDASGFVIDNPNLTIVNGLLLNKRDTASYVMGAASDVIIGRFAAGVLQIGNADLTNNLLLTVGGGGAAAAAQFSGPVKTLSTTVSGLPPAATAGSGARAFVTDANATTFLSTVAGGGSNKVPVVSDGSSWLIG